MTKMEAKPWPYPKRAGYFDAPAVTCDCAACQALHGRFPALKSQHELDAEQGALAPALRVVHGYLTYVAVFAAGWFTSALFSLAKLKGWL